MGRMDSSWESMSDEISDDCPSFFHGVVDGFSHISKIGGLSKSLKKTMMAAWSGKVLQSN